MADDQIFKMGEDKLKLEYKQIKMERRVSVGLTDAQNSLRAVFIYSVGRQLAY